MAAGLFSALAEDGGLDVRAASAGVAALVGKPAAPQAVRTIGELGVDIGGHRARQVDATMVERADLVLTMTPEHREALYQRFGEHREKIQSLPQYTTGDAAAGIADPYGYGLNVFRISAREILRHVELVLDRLGLDSPGT